jgi:predicted molibdopterin-dependent oxidoreductase YjgC
MFERLPQTGQDARSVTVTIDGVAFVASHGDSVAATLLLHDRLAFRVSPTSGKARGPYCMMGVCFDCLVTIDGKPNRQACMTEVAEGMDITTDASGPHHAR